MKQIDRADARSHHEYLQTNAEAIAFDAYALLSALKAWTGYHALRAARSRAAGREDAAEAQYAEVIARDTRAEFDSSLAESTSLIASLTRELRIIAELPGRDTSPLPGKRKDSKAARQTAARLLEAIVPVADALRPPAPPSLLRASSAHPSRWFPIRTSASCDGSWMTVRPFESSVSPTSSTRSVRCLRSSAGPRRS